MSSRAKRGEDEPSAWRSATGVRHRPPPYISILCECDQSISVGIPSERCDYYRFVWISWVSTQPRANSICVNWWQQESSRYPRNAAESGISKTEGGRQSCLGHGGGGRVWLRGPVGGWPAFCDTAFDLCPILIVPVLAVLHSPEFIVVNLILCKIPSSSCLSYFQFSHTRSSWITDYAWISITT